MQHKNSNTKNVVTQLKHTAVGRLSTQIFQHTWESAVENVNDVNCLWCACPDTGKTAPVTSNDLELWETNNKTWKLAVESESETPQSLYLHCFNSVRKKKVF